MSEFLLGLIIGGIVAFIAGFFLACCIIGWMVKRDCPECKRCLGMKK